MLKGNLGKSSGPDTVQSRASEYWGLVLVQQSLDTQALKQNSGPFGLKNSHQ